MKAVVACPATAIARRANPASRSMRLSPPGALGRASTGARPPAAIPKTKVHPTTAAITHRASAIITKSAPGPSLVQWFFCPSQKRPIAPAVPMMATISAKPPLKKRIAPPVER